MKMDSIQAKLLLDRYWEGETSIEEENQLKEFLLTEEGRKSFPEASALFVFYSAESTLSIDESKLTEKIDDKSGGGSDPKVIPFNFSMFRKIAAVFLIVFGGYFVWQNVMSLQVSTDRIVEVEDPKEALRITKEALALAGFKMKQGDAHLKKSLSKLSFTRIIKHDN